MPAQKDHLKPRKPGRPRGSRPNAENRERLIDIALRLFSQQGIARTSLNAIAREAGVTPAMLHYYFNSREQLLDVMIEGRVWRVSRRPGDGVERDGEDAGYCRRTT